MSAEEPGEPMETAVDLSPGMLVCPNPVRGSGVTALTWDTGDFKVRLQTLRHGPPLLTTSLRERWLCLALGKV